MEKLLAKNSKQESRLSLEEFKNSFIDNSNAEELEKLTGGILGTCHDKPKSTLEKVIDWIDEAAKNLGK
ncbi:hypothetical protein OBK30_12805 [Empedobacter falsenii]